MILDLSYPLAESLHLTLPQLSRTQWLPLCQLKSPCHLNIWEFLWVHLWVYFEWNQSLDRAKWSAALRWVGLYNLFFKKPEQERTEHGSWKKSSHCSPFSANLRYGLLLSSDLTPSGPSVHLQTWTRPICVCYYMNTKWLGSGSLGGVLAWHAKSSRFGPQLWSAWTGKEGICPQFQCLGGQGHPILIPILGQKGPTLEFLTF